MDPAPEVISVSERLASDFANHCNGKYERFKNLKWEDFRNEHQEKFRAMDVEDRRRYLLCFEAERYGWRQEQVDYFTPIFAKFTAEFLERFTQSQWEQYYTSELIWKLATPEMRRELYNGPRVNPPEYSLQFRNLPDNSLAALNSYTDVDFSTPAVFVTLTDDQRWLVRVQQTLSWYPEFRTEFVRSENIFRTPAVDEVIRKHPEADYFELLRLLWGAYSPDQRKALCLLWFMHCEKDGWAALVPPLLGDLQGEALQALAQAESHEFEAVRKAVKSKLSLSDRAKWKAASARRQAHEVHRTVHRITHPFENCRMC